jgi:hypothetical protein
MIYFSYQFHGCFYSDLRWTWHFTAFVVWKEQMCLSYVIWKTVWTVNSYIPVLKLNYIHIYMYIYVYKSNPILFWWMPSSGMLHRVALARTGVSEEHCTSIIRVTRIGELGTMLAVTNNQSMLRRNTTPHSITSQKRIFFIVTTRKPKILHSIVLSTFFILNRSSGQKFL